MLRVPLQTLILLDGAGDPWHQKFCPWKLMNIRLMATRNPGFTHELRLVVEIPLFTKGFYTSQVVSRISEPSTVAPENGWLEYFFVSFRGV